MNIAHNLRRLLLHLIEAQPTIRGLRNIGRSNPFQQLANGNRESPPDEAATTRHHQKPHSPTAHSVLQNVRHSAATAPLPNPDDIDWSHEMQTIRSAESRSVLEPLPADADFDPSTAAPFTQPSHNLAAYVKKSACLQQLIQLGVDLHRIERRNGLAEFLLRLDFQRDIEPRLRFLADVGLPAESLGAFLTRNPRILQEDLETLTTRVNYLQSKAFSAAEIGRIVEANPFWLMFSTQRIDGRLGYFQRQFELGGAQIRKLVVRQPRLITYSLEAVRKSTFLVKEELGFGPAETKQLLLAAPKLWMMNGDNLTDRFEYVHKTMGMSHERILQSPELLYCRRHRLHERHEYLRRHDKAQYDPRRPLYVSAAQLTAGTDEEFVLNVAQTTMHDWQTYLRTL